jgi:predicted RNase H-like HicB family nuclease
MLEYHAAYYQIEDGWYMASVLDFPGASTQGRTLNGARRMVKDALQLMAEVTLEQGKPLPKPNPRAKDKKAVLVEPIQLTVRVMTAAPHEKAKTLEIPRQERV